MSDATPRAREERPRLRNERGLPADPGNPVDFESHKPVTPTLNGGAGDNLRRHFIEHTPFWWNEEDLPMVDVFCSTTDALVAAMNDPEEKASSKAALVKEWRAVADHLGVTPASRSRLKVHESKAAIAAGRVKAALEEEQERAAAKSFIDLDDLT